jgi:dTDP-glucose 4,6-dehydratase/UDP-glucuronate decarboxylase
LRGDLSNAGFRAGLPTFDFGIHAACYAQPGRFLADPVTTLALGTEVTLDLLRRVNPHGTLLFLSSSEIYSGLSDPPFGEARTGAVPPDHPRSCYIEAKRCGEVICHAFRSRGVAAKVARVSLAYGPGTRRGDRRALNMFIEKSLSRGEVDLLDAGLAVRTYAYASDVAEVLWRIALEGRDWLYNVGGESTTTVADLARLIGSQTGASVRFPASSAPLAGAPEEVRLDLGKIRAEFGKTRFVSLEEGIARTIRWQRSLYGP